MYTVYIIKFLWPDAHPFKVQYSGGDDELWQWAPTCNEQSQQSNGMVKGEPHPRKVQSLWGKRSHTWRRGWWEVCGLNKLWVCYIFIGWGQGDRGRSYEWFWAQAPHPLSNERAFPSWGLSLMIAGQTKSSMLQRTRHVLLERSFRESNNITQLVSTSAISYHHTRGLVTSVTSVTFSQAPDGYWCLQFCVALVRRRKGLRSQTEAGFASGCVSSLDQICIT